MQIVRQCSFTVRCNDAVLWDHCVCFIAMWWVDVDVAMMCWWGKYLKVRCGNALSRYGCTISMQMYLYCNAMCADVLRCIMQTDVPMPQWTGMRLWPADCLSFTRPESLSLSRTHADTLNCPSLYNPPPQLLQWYSGAGEVLGRWTQWWSPHPPSGAVAPPPPLVAEAWRSTWRDQPIRGRLSRLHQSQPGKQLAPRGDKLVITKLLN